MLASIRFMSRSSAHMQLNGYIPRLTFSNRKAIVVRGPLVSVVVRRVQDSGPICRYVATGIIRALCNDFLNVSANVNKTIHYLERRAIFWEIMKTQFSIPKFARTCLELLYRSKVAQNR